MTSLFSSILKTLDERRAAKRDRAVLERQMASYANHADRLDLQATLDRYPDEQTAELRSILAAQRRLIIQPAQFSKIPSGLGWAAPDPVHKRASVVWSSAADLFDSWHSGGTLLATQAPLGVAGPRKGCLVLGRAEHPGVDASPLPAGLSSLRRCRRSAENAMPAAQTQGFRGVMEIMLGWSGIGKQIQITCVVTSWARSRGRAQGKGASTPQPLEEKECPTS